MEKYKFIKLKSSGRYLVYNDEEDFAKIVETREDAKNLRDRLNLDVNVSDGEVEE